MKKLYLSIVLILASLFTQAQLPVMVSDIKPGAIGGFEYASTYDYYTESFHIVWENNGYIYFTAVNYSSVPNGGTATNNYELWRSDGTAAGTSIVKDIYPGNTGSYPGDFYAINGTLYFTATTPTAGRELWKTDGTTAGTVMVKDIKAGAIGGFEHSSTYDYYSTSFSPVWTQGNTFYFVAIDYSSVPNGNTPSNNYELWKSDGTDVGTVKVKDINSNGSTGSYPGDFYSNNGTLYFTATTAASGRELWKTDGTTAGTILVKDIKAGAIGGFEYSSTYDYYSTSFSPVWTQGNTFFFVAIDYSSVPNGSTANNNYELWKSDGTDVGTVKVKDVNSNGSTGSYPGDFYAFNGSLYFTATTAANGRELWKTDGTTAGTVLVKDIKAGAIGGFEYSSTYDYYSTSFSPVWSQGNTFYFVAIDYSSVPNGGTANNNFELWKSDGTGVGTVKVKDINSNGSTGSYPGDFYANNGTLYFTATTAASGRELWKTDGTTAGTVMVKEIKAGAVGGFEYASTYDYYTMAFTSPFSIGNDFYFVANDYSSVPNGNTPSNNYELWKSDGSAAGTSKVLDIHPSTTVGSYPGEFALALGKVFFAATDNTHGRELWVINAAATDVEELTSDQTLTLYPNPANDQLKIKWRSENLDQSLNKIEVSDLNGRSLLSETLTDAKGDFSYSLNVSNLSPGIYFVNLQGDGYNKTMKFVKQ
jgi:ELWxxDGT repeat protein